jgi:hypothetical protein
VIPGGRSVVRDARSRAWVAAYDRDPIEAASWLEFAESADRLSPTRLLAPELILHVLHGLATSYGLNRSRETNLTR